MEAWCQGLMAGAFVSAVHRDGADEFDLYATGGSNGRSERVYLGTVRAAKNGPRFVRAKCGGA